MPEYNWMSAEQANAEISSLIVIIGGIAGALCCIGAVVFIGVTLRKETKQQKSNVVKIKPATPATQTDE